MIKLKCISDHNSPHLLDADEETAKRLLKSGDYIIVENSGVITEIKEPTDKKKKDEK